VEEEAHRVGGGIFREPGRSFRPAASSERSRWRRAQRQRLRRMTPRGRWSIAASCAVAVAGVVWLAAGSRPADRTPSEIAVGAIGLPPPGMRPPSLPPRAILERLPVSRRALDLRVFGETGDDLGPVSQAGVYGRLFEMLPVTGFEEDGEGGWASPLRVEYTLDAELTRAVFRSLRHARVSLGHVVLLDPATGRVLAYASTDVERFPPTRSYPAASLVKIITAAAALDTAPEKANLPCRFRGSPYRLTPARIDPPRAGNTVSLRRALATSNNQCFAQLAVHAVGQRPLMEAIARFGWLDEPAPAHAAGSADPGEDRFEFGKLGSGLAGCRITPLHAAQLAATLARGELVAPRWIERVADSRGRELLLSDSVSPRRVVSPEIAAELRSMLVDTTRSGTARRAFRKRNGAPLLGPVEVAGKTGSLEGSDPGGRYEWFIGAAPADDPSIAVAVLLVQSDLYWKNASQIAADVLRVFFCSDGPCRAKAAARWIYVPDDTTAAARVAAPLTVGAVNPADGENGPATPARGWESPPRAPAARGPAPRRGRERRCPRSKARRRPLPSERGHLRGPARPRA
jgi:membrane peptidoglycan carboxypeptidase